MPSPPLLVCAPLGIEAMALGKSAHVPLSLLASLRGAQPAAASGLVRVVRTGMGPRRSKKSAAKLAREPGRGVVVAGFGGALDPSLEPGDVVVASEVTCEDSRSTCATDKLAEVLRAEGLRVKVGTIACRDRIVRGDERRALFAEGACAVDMESAWLAAAASDRPFFVVRTIVDGPHHELTDVFATLRGGTRGIKSLARVGRALERFASTL